MIGTYPNRLSFYKNHDFDRTILLPDDAQQVQVEPTEDGNWKIDYLLQDEKREFTGRSRIWIDPKKAYSVLRCESEVHDPQSQFRDVYTTKPKLYGNTWFPEEIRTVRMVAEKVIHEEVIRITKASFNLPISDEEFDWKSFGLPVGREVHHDGNLLYWDGENLTNSFIGPGLPPVEYAGKWRWILILSINILVCGYIAFRLFLKSQKN